MTDSRVDVRTARSERPVTTNAKGPPRRHRVGKNRRNWRAAGTAILTVSAIVLGGALWSTQTSGASANDEKGPVVAFLGDSYTAGTGNRMYWQYTSALMCWHGVNFGKGGTGYVNAGRRHISGNFASRVDALTKANPAIVIIQGSLNDHHAAAVEPAAANLFRLLQQRLSHAKLFAVGPTTHLKQGTATLVAADNRAIQSAAQATGVTFIDGTDFLAADPAVFLVDRIHPNAQGHKLLGQRLAAALPANLNAC